MTNLNEYKETEYIKAYNETIKDLKMTMRNFIISVSNNQITWYIEANRTEEEAEEYYTSGEHELYLSYLIETWVSNVKNKLGYNDEILDDPNFDPTFVITLFDKEWLDDIFEKHILDTNVCLK